MTFSTTLINWYKQNKRDLPWRKTKNPYNIWLSEIMLQQTRVAQGLPYYLAFTETFPTVANLANASEEQVLKLWQGLGYYSRARNLHATAKYITNELNGIFPKNYNELLKLKGVGEYTAAAIASISYNEDIAVVDGNVFRVLARYFGIALDISENKTKKEFQDLANSLLPKGKAALFNQALMEFGAIQCTPKNPNCNNCVFNTSCFALQKNKINELPVKLKRTKITNRYFNYAVVCDNRGYFVIEKRTANGIWKNLFQFPLLETSKSETNLVRLQLIEKYRTKKISVINKKAIIHKLSHQHLHIHFFEVKLTNTIPNAISLEELKTKPFPIVIFNFINANYF
ncbi:A/G-specific adenine glycosylase [Flavobacterium sp.]|uniref:A/G-specific adenine glycosylase n=1 Tax=Flavobacterium sp. TaxID=239 RepID=UPI003527DACA